MNSNDAKVRTIRVLTEQGVTFSWDDRSPLDEESAARVYELLVDEEGVLVPGPGTSWPDGRPGAAHVLDVDLARRRSRGNDARTLTALVLTGRGLGVRGDRWPLAVDEALAIYELLVEEEQVLVPAPGTYYPQQWRRLTPLLN